MIWREAVKTSRSMSKKKITLDEEMDAKCTGASLTTQIASAPAPDPAASTQTRPTDAVSAQILAARETPNMSQDMVIDLHKNPGVGVRANAQPRDEDISMIVATSARQKQNQCGKEEGRDGSSEDQGLIEMLLSEGDDPSNAWQDEDSDEGSLSCH